MASYTVKPGDSLSKIGAQFSVPYSQITGYRSGNPNLIYAGEVLNIPDRAPALPSTTSQPQAQAQPSYSTPQAQSGGGLTADILKSKFGFNDPNVINGILNDPGQVARYTQEAGLGGTTSFNTSRTPVPDFQKIYDTAISEANSGIQPQIDEINSQIDTKTAAYNARVSKIKDNPYLSEATMSGRLSKLHDSYNADVELLTKQSAISQGKLAQGKADAQVRLNIASQQYNVEDQQYQQNLQLYSNLLSSGGFTNASPQDISSAAVAMGVPVSMIQSIISKQKKDSEIKPELRPVDDGTNQYIVALDQNGNVINKSIIGPSTKSSSSTPSGLTPYQQSQQDTQKQQAFEKSISDGISQLQKGIAWGDVWKRIHALYPDVPSELIDTLLGTSWREPGAYQNYQANK